MALTDRLYVLEGRLGEWGRATHDLIDKVQALEAALLSRVPEAIDLSPVASRLDIIEAALLSRDDDGGSRQLSEADDAILSEVKTLAGSIATLGEQFAVLEGVVDRHGAGLAESAASHAKELAAMHEALMKINANQLTLAASFDQRRQDDATLLARLESMDADSARSARMLEGLASAVESMYEVTVARHQRRNRFWYWLFGTDDWISASWPSEAKRNADTLKAVRTTSAR
jgi:hypothetical protein